MNYESYSREIFQKLERFVNIQNQRNLILEKYLKTFKAEFNLKYENKDVADAIKILSYCIVVSALMLSLAYLLKT